MKTTFCLAPPCIMLNLGSLTRDETHAPCSGRQILNYWTCDLGISAAIFFFFCRAISFFFFFYYLFISLAVLGLLHSMRAL